MSCVGDRGEVDTGTWSARCEEAPWLRLPGNLDREPAIGARRAEVLGLLTPANQDEPGPVDRPALRIHTRNSAASRVTYSVAPTFAVADIAPAGGTYPGVNGVLAGYLAVYPNGPQVS